MSSEKATEKPEAVNLLVKSIFSRQIKVSKRKCYLSILELILKMFMRSLDILSFNNAQNQIFSAYTLNDDFSNWDLEIQLRPTHCFLTLPLLND